MHHVTKFSEQTGQGDFGTLSVCVGVVNEVGAVVVVGLTVVVVPAPPAPSDESGIKNVLASRAKPRRTWIRFM